MKQKLKYLVARFFGLFPTKLPVGIAEFDKWATEVIELAQFPVNDSMKFTVATMVLHAKSTAAYSSKEYFVTSLIKAAANQVAAQMIQDLKLKQMEEAKRAAEAQTLLSETVSSNGSIQ